MNESFIWLSGRRLIKKQLLMARICIQIFTENKPVRGLRKKYNIPEVNWLKGQYPHDQTRLSTAWAWNQCPSLR